MNYYEGSDIVIRNMTYADTTFIAISELRQRGQTELEKYLDRLEDQDKGKNIALVAEYKDIDANSKGVIAGCVNIYPYSQHGLFDGECYSEIVDLKVFDKYKNHEIKKMLLDVSERIVSDYSEIVYLSIGFHDGEDLNMYVKRGYVPDRSSLKNRLDDKNDDLILWFSKKLVSTNIYKFPIFNTPKYPFLKWYEDRKKTIEGRVNYGQYREIRVHDKIILSDIESDDIVKGRITFRHEYSTIETMLNFEGIQKMLPFLTDNDFVKGILFLRGLPGWERVAQYGCVAFGIEVEPNDFLDDNL